MEAVVNIFLQGESVVNEILKTLRKGPSTSTTVDKSKEAPAAVKSPYVVFSVRVRSTRIPITSLFHVSIT